MVHRLVREHDQVLRVGSHVAHRREAAPCATPAAPHHNTSSGLLSTTVSFTCARLRGNVCLSYRCKRTKGYSPSHGLTVDSLRDV
eukprot:1185076-Prorocentrum_minimum.AAC.1